MTLSIGFTGSRFGSTPRQRASVLLVIEDLVHLDAAELDGFTAHHGDCVGWDAEFHDIIRPLPGSRIVIHPSLLGGMREHCDGDEIRAPLQPLVRNRKIVLASTVMIAAPAEETQQPRGGTWATVEMARRAGRPLALVLPSGDVSKERWV